MLNSPICTFNIFVHFGNGEKKVGDGDDLHCSLRSIDTRSSILGKDVGVHEVGNSDVDRLARLRLEAKLAIPGHVLDSEQGSVCDDDHVVVAVTDQHAVGGLNHLREHVLDWISRVVALLFWAGIAADEGLAIALSPSDI